MSGEFSIGDLARQVGVNVETIRYYERIGLLLPPTRSPTGRRRYDESDLRTLAFIRKARDLGFSIPDVKALLALRRAEEACGTAKSIASRQLRKVKTDIDHAKMVEQLLAEALSVCPGGGPATNCTVLKMLESRDLVSPRG